MMTGSTVYSNTWLCLFDGEDRTNPGIHMSGSGRTAGPCFLLFPFSTNRIPAARTWARCRCAGFFSCVVVLSAFCACPFTVFPVSCQCPFGSFLVSVSV